MWFSNDCVCFVSDYVSCLCQRLCLTFVHVWLLYCAYCYLNVVVVLVVSLLCECLNRVCVCRCVWVYVWIGWYECGSLHE